MNKFLALCILGLSFLGTIYATSILDDSFEFTLPKLGYSLEALEPHIDKKTMDVHYNGHFETYRTKLNAGLKELRVQSQSDAELKQVFESATGIEELLRNLDSIKNETLRTTIRNNGGGFYNHKLFFASLTNEVRSSRGAGGKYPAAKLFEIFRGTNVELMDKVNEFLGKANNLFGSGWVFAYQYSATPNAIPELRIGSFANQDNPLMNDKEQKVKILVGIDLWEHAFYLKYQNKRADYIAAWKNVINWEFVNNRILMYTNQPIKDEL